MKAVENKMLLDQLLWRYATKKFDSSKVIPQDDWETLEQALLLTPSSYGLQPWKFFVVTDRDTRKKLLPFSWNQSQVVDSSHLVVFAIKSTIDEEHIDQHLKRITEVRGTPVEALGGYKKMMMGSLVPPAPGFEIAFWARYQVYIALGQFMVAAAMLGIDTCPMEGFQPPKYDEVLGLTELGYASVVLATAGYRSPEDRNASMIKVRFKPEDVIQHLKVS